MLALMRFRFRNDGANPVTAELPIQYSQDAARTGQGGNQDDHRIPRGPLDELTIQDHNILSAFDGRLYVRCQLETAMAVEPNGSTVILKRELQPGETCEAVLKIPYVVPVGDAEMKALKGIHFDACLPEVAKYWRNIAGRGARLTTPEPQLSAAHLSPRPRADGRLSDAGRPHQYLRGYFHLRQLLERILHDCQ